MYLLEQTIFMSDTRIKTSHILKLQLCGLNVLHLPSDTLFILSNALAPLLKGENASKVTICVNLAKSKMAS